MTETMKAADRRVRKGRWIYCDTEPTGWFLITYRAEAPGADGKIYVAVNGRGPSYAIHLDPTEDVTVRC